MQALFQSVRGTKSLVVSLCLTTTLLFTTSCGKDGGNNIDIPGIRGPIVNIIEDTIIISFVYEKFAIPAGARFKIPNYEHSYVEISPDLESNGTLLQLQISLQDVMGGDLETLDPQRLPGGRPLPGVASGELPAVAFTIEEFHNVSLYLGKHVYGVFVPVKLPLKESIPTFRFYIDGKRMGNISLVGKDSNGENDGVLLMLDLAAETKQLLQEIADQHAYGGNYGSGGRRGGRSRRGRR